jgi:hypothetical protein
MQIRGERKRDERDNTETSAGVRRSLHLLVERIELLVVIISNRRVLHFVLVVLVVLFPSRPPSERMGHCDPSAALPVPICAHQRPPTLDTLQSNLPRANEQPGSRSPTHVALHRRSNLQPPCCIAPRAHPKASLMVNGHHRCFCFSAFNFFCFQPLTVRIQRIKKSLLASYASTVANGFLESTLAIATAVLFAGQEGACDRGGGTQA